MGYEPYRNSYHAELRRARRRAQRRLRFALVLALLLLLSALITRIIDGEKEKHRPNRPNPPRRGKAFWHRCRLKTAPL